MVLGNLVWAELPPRNTGELDNELNDNENAHENGSNTMDINND